MIIHQYSDGSQGFEYEVGDRVIVEKTICGGWFDFGPSRAEFCTIRKIEGWHYSTSKLFIHYSNDWGHAESFPWMVKPHSDTIERATMVMVEPLSK